MEKMTTKMSLPIVFLNFDSAFIWTSVDVKNNSDYTCTPNIYASKPAALYDVTFRESRVSLYVDVAASIFQ